MIRNILMTVISLSLLVVFGCSDPAAEKFETAQFEEQQFNKPHATQLYREIIESHPDSSYAEKARVRLKELQGGVSTASMQP